MSDRGARAFLHPVTFEPIPHFTLPPVEVRQVDAEYWDILTPVYFRDDDGRIFQAEAKEPTNFASIPWLVRNIPFLGLTRSGPWNAATVVHDDECTERVFPSREVHARFGRMLDILPMNRFQRWAMKRAVQIGGPRFEGTPLREGV